MHPDFGNDLHREFFNIQGDQVIVNDPCGIVYQDVRRIGIGCIAEDLDVGFAFLLKFPGKITTEYDHHFRNVHVMFENDDLKNTLGKLGLKLEPATEPVQMLVVEGAR